MFNYTWPPDSLASLYAAATLHAESVLARLCAPESRLAFLCVVDVDWLAWLLYPVVVTFVLPIVIVVFLYASALVLQLYALRRYYRDTFLHAPANAAAF